jgi:hypothetical protein
MGQAIPNQHPAVVSRAHFNQLRTLLAVALIAVIGLTVAVVILARDEQRVRDTSPAAALGQLNYGGYNPTVARPQSAPQATAVEGTRGAVKDYSKNSATGDYPRASAQPPSTRHDSALEEGARAPGFRTH